MFTRPRCPWRPELEGSRTHQCSKLMSVGAAATMERTQDEILAEALTRWLDEHHSEQ